MCNIHVSPFGGTPDQETVLYSIASSKDYNNLLSLVHPPLALILQRSYRIFYYSHLQADGPFSGNGDAGLVVGVSDKVGLSDVSFWV